MIDQIKAWIQKAQQVWDMLQDLASMKGGLYVDLFAIAVLLRLLGPLKGYPSMTIQEAGLWAATIGSFAFSGNGPKDGTA